MDIIVATDGSKQSLAAAKELRRMSNASEVTAVTVVAVVSPMSAVPFINDLGPRRKAGSAPEVSYREEAQKAVGQVAAVFDGWGPKVTTKLRSGSPANEIVKLATQTGADLVVVASGSRGLSDTILLGSTATRVQHSAPCPVLVYRRKRTR